MSPERRIGLGDRVRVDETDCCIGFRGEGHVAAVRYADQEDDWGEVPEEERAWYADDLLSITIGGVTMVGLSHPLSVELLEPAPVWKDYAIAGVSTTGCVVCGKSFMFTRTVDNHDEAYDAGWSGDGQGGWLCPEHRRVEVDSP